MVLFPPAVYIPWPYSAFSWSVFGAWPCCTPFPVTPTLIIPPISECIVITPHISPPPLLQRPPHRSVSWTPRGFYPCVALVMIPPLLIHILRNLPVTYSYPWMCIPLLSPSIFTPPRLAAPRWIQGCIILPLSSLVLSTGRPSQTYLQAPAVSLSPIWGFDPQCNRHLRRTQFLVCPPLNPTLFSPPMYRILLTAPPLPLHRPLC